MRFQNILSAATAALALSVTLVACGGGGGGSSAAPPTTPTPSPAPSPTAGTAVYESQPDSATMDAFLAQLQAQGARGFRYMHHLYSPTETVALYVKDRETTYSYELAQEPTGTVYELEFAEYEDWLNRHGARGFAWLGRALIGNAERVVLRKDLGTNATYRYIVQEQMDVRVPQFAQQVTQLGSAGNYPLAISYSRVGGMRSMIIYEKDSSSSSTYALEVLAGATTGPDYLEQLNAQGARGFRYKLSTMDLQGSYALYEKDTSQNTSFRFNAVPDITDFSTYIAQANTEGAQGHSLFSGYEQTFFQDTLFLTATDCAGRLCGSRNLYWY